MDSQFNMNSAAKKKKKAVNNAKKDDYKAILFALITNFTHTQTHTTPIIAKVTNINAIKSRLSLTIDRNLDDELLFVCWCVYVCMCLLVVPLIARFTIDNLNTDSFRHNAIV